MTSTVKDLCDMCLPGSPNAKAESFAITVDDCVFDAMMDEVEKLKPKKRKNYRSYLRDDRGQKTRVIFKDGILQNYSLITRSFQPIVPFRVVLSASTHSNISVEATSNVGDLMLNHGIPGNVAVRATAIANHTGNHESNVRHRIKIPRPRANANGA